MVRERLFDIDDIDFEVALTASRGGSGGSGGGSNSRGSKKGNSENSPHVRARLHLWRLLSVLCDAPEFAELPVRHCEDELNEQLCRELTVLQGDNVNDGHSLLCYFTQYCEFGSAHGKAFLLMLAHLEGAALPISDYINDTKMVQDQVTRVLKAMVDIAAEEGLFDIVLRLCYLSQLLMQGVTSSVSELCQLPSVDSVVAAAMVSRGVSSVKQLQQMGYEKVRRLAADCLLLSSEVSNSSNSGGRGRGGGGNSGRGGGSRGGAAKSGSEYENSVKVSEFLRVVKELPDIEVRAVRVRAVDEHDSVGQGCVVYALSTDNTATTSANTTVNTTSNTTANATFNTTAPLILHIGAVYEVEVVVRVRNQTSDFGNSDHSPRSNNSNTNNNRPRGDRNVFTKKPHKPKPASWYLVAGLVDAPNTTNVKAPNTTNVKADANPKAATTAANALRNVYHTDVRRNGSIETRGELVALKSVSLNGGDDITLSISFTVPDIVEESGAGVVNKTKALSLVLACDAILGVDVAVSVPVLLA